MLFFLMILWISFMLHAVLMDSSLNCLSDICVGFVSDNNVNYLVE